MPKRVVLPSGAVDDVCTLLQLSSDQLASLDRLFATGESASPLRPSFINRVAETLNVRLDQARSVVMVCHFLLLQPDDLRIEDPEYARELLDDLREFVESDVPESDKTTLLASLDTNRMMLESLAMPKPDRLRAQKIRRLASGPEQSILSIRTLCQLRPLFEGPEHEEQIVGLVPTIVLEVEATDADGDAQTVAFSLNSDALRSLEQVVKRTQEKLAAIREKYGDELLDED
jgi:hypothetical protein